MDVNPLKGFSSVKRAYLLFLLLPVLFVAASQTNAAKRTRKVGVKHKTTAPSERGIGKIVFVSGSGDIAVMNANGTHRTVLLHDESLNTSPHFSSDSQKIVFDTNRHGNSEIYSMNADGTGQKRLTNNNFIDQNASFSPNRKQIVFASKRDGDFAIYMMNVDGSQQKQITHNETDDDDPSFSPDGQKIVFTSDYTDLGGSNAHAEICVMNADGSTRKRLTKNDAYSTDPCFSPDGKKIAFSTAAFETSNRLSAQIFLMNADGTHLKRVTMSQFGHSAGSPSFSPDGKRIAFSSNRYSPDHATPGREDLLNIFIISLDGSGETPITQGKDGDYHSDPSWARGWVHKPKTVRK